MRAPYALLLLTGVVAAVLLALHPWNGGRVLDSRGPTSAPAAAQPHPASPAAPPLAPASPASQAGRDITPAQFVTRLRCSLRHAMFYGQVSQETMALLCAGRLVDAGKALAVQAQAGDRRAAMALALLAQCETVAAPAGRRERAVQAARNRGADATTLARLDALLAADDQEPSASDKAQCQQLHGLLSATAPVMRTDAENVFGRRLDTLNDEDEQDLEIEYLRKTLSPGDADAETRLAQALLRKGTPDSQSEALALLRAAQASSPAAAGALANCLLKGCPTPADDPTEAQQLLERAALAGDADALNRLGTAPENSGTDTQLPAAERYAWAEVLWQLNARGCFGPSGYLGFAFGHPERPDSASLSPADAALAAQRSAELLQNLPAMTRQLGCD